MTTKTAHTPGPWAVGTGWVYQDDGGEKPGRMICGGFPAIYRDDGESEANARLIAASPDMAEALGQFLLAYKAWNDNKDGGEDDLHEAARVAREAIAKAQGGQ